MTIKEDLQARLGQGLVGRLDLDPEDANKVVLNLDGFLDWLAKDGPLVMPPGAFTSPPRGYFTLRDQKSLVGPFSVRLASVLGMAIGERVDGFKFVSAFKPVDLPDWAKPDRGRMLEQLLWSSYGERGCLSSILDRQLDELRDQGRLSEDLDAKITRTIEIVFSDRLENRLTALAGADLGNAERGLLFIQHRMALHAFLVHSVLGNGFDVGRLEPLLNWALVECPPLWRLPASEPNIWLIMSQ